MNYPIEVFKQQKQPTLYISIYITDYCNYKCWYCYNTKTLQPYNINFDKVLKFLISIRAKYTMHLDINLLGGEPTQHPEIYEFIYNCNTQLTNYTLHIITNLSKSTEFYKSLYQYNCKITASYHSEYSFNIFFTKIQELSAYKAIKAIIVMCNPYKFKESLNAYNELYNLSLSTNQKFKVELNMVDKFAYNQDQVTEINKNMKNIHEYTVKYSNNTIDKVSFSDIANNSKFNFKLWQCNAGKDILYIHNSGNIYPCESWFSEKLPMIGNIQQLDFKLSIKPILCKCNNCSGDFNIYKKNIFKKSL